MRNTRGFTLIELVIVIVILGILGAVAAPRFINMQGDAYEANVKALGGSIQAAMTLGNTKAILNGYDKIGIAYTDLDYNKVDSPNSDAEAGNDVIKFVYGFPDSHPIGIIRMLQDSDSFSIDNDDDTSYLMSTGGTEIRIAPRARGSNGLTKKCRVIYTRAGVDKPAEVTVETDDC